MTGELLAKRSERLVGGKRPGRLRTRRVGGRSGLLGRGGGSGLGVGLGGLGNLLLVGEPQVVGSVVLGFPRLALGLVAFEPLARLRVCLLYTSDAADDIALV